MCHEIYKNKTGNISIEKNYQKESKVTDYKLNLKYASVHFSKQELLTELTAMIRSVGGRKYHLED